MGRDHSTAIDLPRRRVLTATASGAALSTAGCTAFDADENDVDPDDTSDAGDGDDTTDADADGEPSGEAAATISVDVTEKLDAVEADPREQLEADGITETEASTRFQEAEIEIVTEAMDAIEVAVADSDGVTVADSELGRGVPLVDGEPDSLITCLRSTMCLDFSRLTIFNPDRAPCYRHATMRDDSEPDAPVVRRHGRSLPPPLWG